MLDLETLRSIPQRTTIAKPLAMFPAVEFDETLPLPKTNYATLIQKLRGISPLLTEIRTVNVYEGSDTRTITLRCTYRSSERTLTQEEVEKIHAQVVAELKKA